MTGSEASPALVHRDGRGQFVLLAGVVVALALVAMLTAYLQLGYHAGVASASGDRPVTDGQRYLERATSEAITPVRGQYGWDQRAAAVQTVRDRLAPRLDRLERSRVEQGMVTRASVNESAAAAWADANCPGGDGRAFGSCRSDRGVVVQERADRTTVLAVAFDLSVTTSHGTTRLSTVVTVAG